MGKVAEKNREKLKNLELNNMHLETMRAYQLRENFQLIFEAKARGYSTKRNLIAIVCQST